MKFKQAIKIGKNVTDIINLPCVIGCRKEYRSDSVFTIAYHLFGDTQNYHAQWGEVNRAYEGDWLCEDKDGKWHVLSEKEYQQ